MDGPDIKKFAAIAALCLAAAQAAAQQAPLPLPAEIDASGPGQPKGEGNARNATQQARKEAGYRAAQKKCDELSAAAARTACAAQAEKDKASDDAATQDRRQDLPAPPAGPGSTSPGKSAP